MKGRSTLVLFASVIVLVGFIWLQQTWRNKVPSRELRRVQLFELDYGTLISMEFAYTNQVIRCVKENGVWMTGGEEGGLGRADVALVGGVVHGLNSLGKGTTITAKQLEVRGFDESEYGFVPAVLKITALDNRGKHVWLVGRTGPLGDVLYIKEGGGEDIFTISQSLHSFVPKAEDELRDRVAFSVDIAASRQLEVRGPGGFVQIMKGSDGTWQIQQPMVAAADETEVEAFLKRLQAVRIESFVADNVSDFSVYGLQSETHQISLGGVDGASRMLMLGDPIPDRPDFVYARRADDTTVFTLNKDVMDLVDFKLDHFRNRRVLPLASSAIDSFSIKHGSEQLDLAVTDEEWGITAPVRWAADLHAVTEWIAIWDEAVIVEFSDAGSDETAEWSYIFGSTELGQTNAIHVLPTEGRMDGIRIRRDTEDTIYQLNLPAVPEAGTDPLNFKDRLVWQMDTNAIQKLSVNGRMNRLLAIERHEDGSFVPNGTNGTLTVDQQALDTLLGGMGVLMASSYVTYDPRDLSGYGLDQPALSVHVGLSGTNQLGRVLLIGEEMEKGYYSMVQGRDVVFLLPKDVVGAFYQNLFIDPEAVPAEPE